MFKFLIGAALAFGAAAPALPQSPPPDSSFWTRSDNRVAFATAGISFPERAGVTSLQRSMEFSRRGEGLDNALQYHSRDQEVFATVYVYYPGLPHAGITAFATDNAIRVQSSLGLRLLSRRVVSVGGRDGTAIRADYSGFREGMASSASFMKAGRWIVKLRVSGPESRRRDVERTMTDLLAGIRFEGDLAPRPPEPLEVTDCRDQPARRAALLPSTASDALDEAVIGVLDGAGDEGRERDAAHRAGTPLVGPLWCLSSRARFGDSIVPVLRAGAGADGDLNRSVLIAIASDSGTLIEVVHSPRRNRFVLFLHDIGQTRLLGAFDAVPTDEQIVDVLSGADPAGGQARATISHKTDGNTDVTLHVPPEQGEETEAAIPTT